MVMKANTLQSDPITIPAGEFKAKCLKLMDEANLAQRRIRITKRGKSVGSFVPEALEKKPFQSVIGRCGPIQIIGDIISPLPEEDTTPIDPFLG